MYAWRQQFLPLLCFRIKAMRRVPETNIFLRNNNCTTALSTARCYFEATDDFPIFLSSRRLFLKISTEIKREDIIQSLMTRKIVIFQEMRSMNVDYTFCCSFTQNIHSFTSTVETIRQIYVISTSMNFINANELSITLFACVLTFNSING